MGGRFDEGARTVARAIGRRAFLRRSAGTVFKAAAVLAAGGGLELAFGGTAAAYVDCNSAGPGCPYGCGPSACCSKKSRPAKCQCAHGAPEGAAGPGVKCKHTRHCHGRDDTWNGTSCWTCHGAWFTCSGGCSCRQNTLCCDCKTSGCGDRSGRCIGWYRKRQKVC